MTERGPGARQMHRHRRDEQAARDRGRQEQPPCRPAGQHAACPVETPGPAQVRPDQAGQPPDVGEDMDRHHPEPEHEERLVQEEPRPGGRPGEGQSHPRAEHADRRDQDERPQQAQQGRGRPLAPVLRGARVVAHEAVGHRADLERHRADQQHAEEEVHGDQLVDGQDGETLGREQQQQQRAGGRGEPLVALSAAGAVPGSRRPGRAGLVPGTPGGPGPAGRRTLAAARILRGGVIAGAIRAERAAGAARGTGVTAGLGSRSVARHPLTSSLLTEAAWPRPGAAAAAPGRTDARGHLIPHLKPAGAAARNWFRNCSEPVSKSATSGGSGPADAVRPLGRQDHGHGQAPARRI